MSKLSEGIKKDHSWEWLIGDQIKGNIAEPWVENERLLG
jgi:hypothetical protein